MLAAPSGVEHIARRFDAAWGRKALWDTVLRDAYEWAYPYAGAFEGRSNEDPLDHLWSSVLPEAVERFRDRMLSGFTPPELDFIQLRASKPTPPALKTELDRILATAQTAFLLAVRRGGFATAASEFYVDYFFGTGAMHLVPGRDVWVRYRCMPAGSYGFDLGPDGKPRDTYRRHHDVPLRLVEEKFSLPGKPLRVPAAWRRMIEGNADARVTLDEATIHDPERGLWVCTLLWRGGEGTGLHVVQESETPWNPFVIARWAVRPGETWGRGPALTALPDAKTLNQTVELVMMNAAINLSGMWAVAADAVSAETISLEPGVFQPFDTHGRPIGDVVQPLNFGGRFDVGAVVMEQLETRIKRITRDDRLPDEAGPVRSAYEIAQRAKELAADIGAAFPRAVEEFLVPLVDTTLAIVHAQAGIANRVPMKSQFVDLVPTSPLAQLQGLADAEGALRWLQELQGILPPHEFAVQVRLDEVGEYLAKAQGVDLDLVRPRELREAARKEMMAAADRMMADAEGAPPPELEAAAA